LLWNLLESRKNPNRRVAGELLAATAILISEASSRSLTSAQDIGKRGLQLIGTDGVAAASQQLARGATAATTLTRQVTISVVQGSTVATKLARNASTAVIEVSSDAASAATSKATAAASTATAAASTATSKAAAAATTATSTTLTKSKSFSRRLSASLPSPTKLKKRVSSIGRKKKSDA
jgi:hypothetical protein